MLVVGRAVQRHAGARALGLIHGDVGAAQQRVGVLTVLGCDGDADAGVDVDRLALEHERRLQHAHEVLGDLRGARGVGAGQQHRELVAAQASHQVGRPHRALQALADLLQQQVADLVAQRVVDFLEAIQVEQQQRALRLVPRSIAERVSSRSCSSTRLGRPVSPSCSAWCRRSASARVRSSSAFSVRTCSSVRLRSVTSRAWTTMPATLGVFNRLVAVDSSTR